MKRVPMPPDTNEQVVFTKRSMREAWPNFDEEQFRADLGKADQLLDELEAKERANRRNDFLVNAAIVVCSAIVLILLVSGNL